MKPPAFQFYAAEYLADEHVQLMTLEEEGAYIRLLAFCWREGSIPSDLNALSRLCKGASTTLLTVVQARFNQHPQFGDRLVHPRLEIERLKQLQWREKSALGGKASAGKRKHPKALSAEQGGSTTVPPARLKGGSTLQSSPSSSSSNGKRSRADKPRDSRIDHPALKSVLEVKGSYSHKDTWDLIIKVLGDEPDVERMRECWLEWRTRDFKPTNLGWLTDWYVNGIPTVRESRGSRVAYFDPAKNPKGNGDEPQEKPPLPVVSDEDLRKLRELGV